MKSLFRFSLLVILWLSACATPTRTNTPQPTKVQPTRPTKTPLPRPTYTARPASVRACVTNSTIRIRQGPGKDFEVIGGMVSGTCMSIQGRNSDASWVYMVSEDGKSGWVAASLLTIKGDLSKVSLSSETAAVSLAPTAKKAPTSTRKPVVRATNTPQPLLTEFIDCSETNGNIGKQVSCQIPRAYCDYFPAVDGSPTFCNDRPYPNHNFAMVVWGVDWSELDGSCLIVSGYVGQYRGKPQIEVFSTSQVSYCE